MFFFNLTNYFFLYDLVSKIQTRSHTKSMQFKRPFLITMTKFPIQLQIWPLCFNWGKKLFRMNCYNCYYIKFMMVSLMETLVNIIFLMLRPNKDTRFLKMSSNLWLIWSGTRLLSHKNEMNRSQFGKVMFLFEFWLTHLCCAVAGGSLQIKKGEISKFFLSRACYS